MGLRSAVICSRAWSVYRFPSFWNRAADLFSWLSQTEYFERLDHLNKTSHACLQKFTFLLFTTQPSCTTLGRSFIIVSHNTSVDYYDDLTFTPPLSCKRPIDGLVGYHSSFYRFSVASGWWNSIKNCRSTIMPWAIMWASIFILCDCYVLFSVKGKDKTSVEE